MCVISSYKLSLGISLFLRLLQLLLQLDQFSPRLVVGTRVLEVQQKLLVDTLHRLLGLGLRLVDTISMIFPVLMVS